MMVWAISGTLDNTTASGRLFKMIRVALRPYSSSWRIRVR